MPLEQPTWNERTSKNMHETRIWMFVRGKVTFEVMSDFLRSRSFHFGWKPRKKKGNGEKRSESKKGKVDSLAKLLRADQANRDGGAFNFRGEIYDAVGENWTRTQESIIYDDVIDAPLDNNPQRTLCSLSITAAKCIRFGADRKA